MKTIENEGFFANARTFLEKQVNKIARQRGYIDKKACVFTHVIVTDVYEHLYLDFHNGNKSTFVVLSLIDDSMEIFEPVLFPAKQKFPKLVKTIAETVISRLFEN
jgi:hypothetical protein